MSGDPSPSTSSGSGFRLATQTPPERLKMYFFVIDSPPELRYSLAALWGGSVQLFEKLDVSDRPSAIRQINPKSEWKRRFDRSVTVRLKLSSAFVFNTGAMGGGSCDLLLESPRPPGSRVIADIGRCVLKFMDRQGSFSRADKW